MSNLVCVVAGGEWQAAIINKLHDNNCEVLCLNLYSDTLGAKLADYFEQVDVVDRSACLKIINNYQVMGVLTDQSDISVPTVAYLAEQLNLKGIGFEHALLFTNKLLMRAKAKALGVHCPEYFVAPDKISAKKYILERGLPVIVKPINSQASRGVILIDHWEKLDDAIAEAFLHSKDEEPILVEEFIIGQEWTVEGFKQSNSHTSLAISFKEHFPELPTVASSINYVPISDNNLHQELVKQNDLLIEGMGLAFGITHAEYKYANGKFYLIEVAARGGGANISSHVIPLMSGIDVNQLLIEYALGKPENKITSKASSKYVVIYFLNFSSGKVAARTEELQLLSLPFVVDYKYNFNLGDVIEPISNDATRHAHVILSADSRNEMNECIIKIVELVKVQYE
jgi:biotin carboxylase